MCHFIRVFSILTCIISIVLSTILASVGILLWLCPGVLWSTLSCLAGALCIIAALAILIRLLQALILTY